MCTPMHTHAHTRTHTHTHAMTMTISHTHTSWYTLTFWFSHTLVKPIIPKMSQSWRLNPALILTPYYLPLKPSLSFSLTYVCQQALPNYKHSQSLLTHTHLRALIKPMKQKLFGPETLWSRNLKSTKFNSSLSARALRETEAKNCRLDAPNLFDWRYGSF